MPTSLARVQPLAAGAAGVRMPQQCLRVILYGRVSDDHYVGTSGTKRSVNQQLKTGRRIAGERGWEIAGEFWDNDQSASQYARGAREDWPKVEEMIRAGEADILWLWEISRGTRDRIVWAHLVDACQTHRMWLALDEDLWDTTNPDHMRYLDGLMADSIHESGKTRKRVLRDMTDHAEEGKPHGPTHYAYDREYDPRTGELIRQVPNAERAGRCVDIADRLLRKKQPRTSIAAEFNRQGVRTPHGRLMGEEWYTRRGKRMVAQGWTSETIDTIMSSPSLMGKRSHNGRIIGEGGWEAVLDEPTWLAVQKLLGPKARQAPKGEGSEPRKVIPREAAAEYLASAIMVCDVCGAATYVKPQSGKSTLSYYCSGLGKGAPLHGSRALATVDDAIEQQLFERLAHPDVRAALVPQENADARRRAQDTVAALEEELERLYEDVQSGSVSRRMAQADEQRLTQELGLARANAAPRLVDPLAEQLALGDPEAVWSGWGLSQRRAALKLLTEEVRLLRIGAGGRRKRPPEEHVKIVWKGVLTQ
ncbi:recombinase family protein [Nocardiopsis tropica]|uniref:recombinase family protein n=1 Tax=Nocardiopsis tropica TaxID=109330 RepID=UPI0031D0F13B